MNALILNKSLKETREIRISLKPLNQLYFICIPDQNANSDKQEEQYVISNPFHRQVGLFL